MATAARDSNRVPTILGISNADGVTPAPAYAGSADHGLRTANSSGTVPASNIAALDPNRVHTLIAASSVDGTPVTIGLDASNHGIFIENH